MTFIFASSKLYSQSEQGYIVIDTIKGENGYTRVDTSLGFFVTYTALTSYDVEVMKLQKEIYQNGMLYKREIIDCEPTDRNIRWTEYFPRGYSYEIRLLNPATQTSIYLPCKFKF